MNNDPATKKNLLSIFERKDEAGLSNIVVEEIATVSFEELTSQIVKKANDIMSNQQLTLLDISTVTCVGAEIVDGKIYRAFLFFSPVKDENPKTLKAITKKIDTDD